MRLRAWMGVRCETRFECAIADIDDGQLSPDALRVDLDKCEVNGSRVCDIDSFKNWIRTDVRRLLPHGIFACVHGRIYGVGISPDYVVTVDFPPKHLLAIRNASGHMDTPLASRWFEKQRPVFFDERYPPVKISEAWLGNFRESDLRNAAADGVLDQANCIATYFSFHQLPALDEPALRRTFRGLTPMLHETFARVIRLRQGSAFTLKNYERLSAREREIADYISKGKSNGEIAKLLSVSDNTIRNHVSRIFDKTGCGNRAGLARLVAQQASMSYGLGTKVL